SVVINLPAVSYTAICCTNKFSPLVIFTMFVAGLGYKLNFWAKKLSALSMCGGTAFNAVILMLSYLLVKGVELRPGALNQIKNSDGLKSSKRFVELLLVKKSPTKTDVL